LAVERRRARASRRRARGADSARRGAEDVRRRRFGQRASRGGATMSNTRRRMAFGLGALLVAATALDAQNVLDVTLRVVDDVTDLDAVVMEIGGPAASSTREPATVEDESAVEPPSPNSTIRERAPAPPN